MAEAVGYDDAKPEVAAANMNKRKRQSLDEGTPRPAPGYSRPQSASNAAGGPNDSSDQNSTSFLTQNTSGSGDNDLQQSSSGGLDFSGLTQHNAGDHSLQANGGANASNASDTAAAALSHYSMQVPQSTEMSFQNQNAPNSDPDQQMMSELGLRRRGLAGFDLETFKAHIDAQVHQNATSPTSANNGSKPPVGSEEWHKVRRDNHKEVERRRRETINEGINELAKIVPGCEKNKGSILQNAVRFITQLKENEAQNIEKWTLEKLLTEQAISELSASCEKFKTECQRAWSEAEMYKKACEKAGIPTEELKVQNASGDQNGDS